MSDEIKLSDEEIYGKPVFIELTKSARMVQDASAPVSEWTKGGAAKRANDNRRKRKSRKLKRVDKMCPMRCCSHLWRQENNVNEIEARYFKLLCDDLWGFMHSLGFLANDFPTIAHLFATFSVPSVIAAYNNANKVEPTDTYDRQRLAERVAGIRDLREAMKGARPSPYSPRCFAFKSIGAGKISQIPVEVALPENLIISNEKTTNASGELAPLQGNTDKH